MRGRRWWWGYEIRLLHVRVLGYCAGCAGNECITKDEGLWCFVLGNSNLKCGRWLEWFRRGGENTVENE